MIAYDKCKLNIISTSVTVRAHMLARVCSRWGWGWPDMGVCGCYKCWSEKFEFTWTKDLECNAILSTLLSTLNQSTAMSLRKGSPPTTCMTRDAHDIEPELNNICMHVNIEEGNQVQK